MNKAVFLDRDGVINKVIVKNGKAFSPRHFEEFELVDNIEGEIKRIKDAGYIIVVVTNQPDIARGKMSISELNKMNEVIHSKMLVDDILICPHDDIDDCLCRKPKIGMILSAVQKYKIDLNASFLVGDSWKDMVAAKNAHCKGIMINACYNEGVDSFERVRNIKEAVNLIIKEKEET